MLADFHRPSLSGSPRTSKTETDRPTDRNCDRYIALAQRASAIKMLTTITHQNANNFDMNYSVIYRLHKKANSYNP